MCDKPQLLLDHLSLSELLLSRMRVRLKWQQRQKCVTGPLHPAAALLFDVHTALLLGARQRPQAKAVESRLPECGTAGDVAQKGSCHPRVCSSLSFPPENTGMSSTAAGTFWVRGMLSIMSLLRRWDSSWIALPPPRPCLRPGIMS